MTISGDDFSFGALLHTFRKRKHRTQQELATSLGVHRRTLIRWEQGDYLPNSKALVLELARRLKLDNQETHQLLEASLTAVTPYFLVPLPRNPFFTGREDILEVLHRQLDIEQTVALTQSSALHGLGGVGKTQIALEYAYRHVLDYSALFWIAAETHESITSSFLHIAEVLQLPEREDKEQQHVVTAVQRWLSVHSKWLLIWDNVEDLDVLHHFLPATPSGAALITTRRQVVGKLSWSLDLLPMKHEEAMLFLLRRARVLTPDASYEHMSQFARQMPVQSSVVANLVTELGGLPLALDQAGAYLEETHCGLPAYLDLFRTQRAALLQHRGEGSRDHPESVFTTFTLALTALSQRHPAVGDFLRICALLQADAIPEEIFCQGGEYLGAELAGICGEPLEWNRLVSLACSYSLLSRQSEAQTLSMHRLVQAVIKEHMLQATEHTWMMSLLQAISHIFPDDETQADYLQRCERLLPHALHCLIWSEQWNEREISHLSLIVNVAIYLQRRVRYTEAEALFLRALRLAEYARGAEQLLIIAALEGLAAYRQRQMHYEEAESLFKRALQLQESILGAEHPQIAVSLTRLALLYRRQGKWGEAEVLFRRALDMQEHIPGDEHPQIADTLSGLAGVYREQGKYAEAESLLVRALYIREQTLGNQHFVVAESLHNLAATYLTQEKYEAAEPLFLRALHIWERVWGPDDPDVAYALNGLAELYREVGKYEQAESCFLRALDIKEQGPSRRAELLQGLAGLYVKQGRYEQAESCYQQALSVREQHLSLLHPDIAEILHDVALLHQKQGKLNEALSCAKRALDIRFPSLGEAHGKTIATQTLYAQLLREQARMPERTLSDCHDEAADVLEAEHPLHDPLQGFLDACCELHPLAWCRSADLWRAYQQWIAEQHEAYSLSRGAFIVQLKAHDCQASRTKTARIWRGIALVRKQDDGR